MKQTNLINIYGPPGSGKSTLAAELYAHMKQKGYSVELVREEIKDWAWQGKKPTVFEQVYITNKQMLTESNLYGKVEFLITDSPLALGNFYCQYYHNSDALEDLASCTYNTARVKNLVSKVINLYVPINENIYNTEGRYSSLEEAIKLDEELKKHLTDELRVLYCSPGNRLINSIEYIRVKHNNWIDYHQ